MVLTHFEIHRFKCLRELKLDFKPGLNVIRGPNEAGKSTLRAALMAALFGNPTSQSEAVERWTSWGLSERCELKLEYLDRAGQACQLRKDFANQKVFLVTDAESFKTPKAIQTQVAEELGIASEEFYQLCACLDVRSLANLGSVNNRKEVGKIIAGLMTGTSSGDDALQIIKRLGDSLKELAKGMNSASKTPGPLKEATDRIPQLIAEREKVNKSLAARQERQRELDGLKGSIAQAETQWKDLNHLLTANRKLAEARKRQEILVKQDTEYGQREDTQQRLQAEVKALDAKIQADPGSRFAASEINELRACLDRQVQLEAENQAAAAVVRPTQFWLPVGIGLAVIGLCFVQRPLGWILLAAGAVCGWLGWQRQRQMHAQDQTGQSKRTALEAEKQTLTRKIQVLADKSGGLNPAQLLEKWPEAQRLLAERNALERRIRETEPVNQEAWKNLRSELRLAKDTVEEQQLQALQVSPLELAGREREFQSLAAGLEQTKCRRDRLQAIQDHDASNNDQLQALEESIALQRERISYLEQRDRIGNLTLTLLNQAQRETLNPARKVLEEKAGALFAALSGGRYQRINVDDEDLACKVFIPETERWEDPNVLSQGAFDQFYLSLRTALSDILTGGKNAPFLLDEPLAAFDPERQALALEWLRRLSRDRQILFFTCRPDYDKMADQVIELKRQSA